MTGPSSAADVHVEAAARLERSGQRYTAQRRRLIDILTRAGQPLSIPQILRGRKGLAQSSVYRNLADLEEAGVVRRVLLDEEFARYELTEDLTGHHHHLSCSSCGRTSDVTLPAGLERDLDRVLDAVARDAGFADVSHRLDLIGICDDCAARARAAGTQG
jgi:Fur family ferric uptake transcriptional regulator